MNKRMVRVGTVMLSLVAATGPLWAAPAEPAGLRLDPAVPGPRQPAPLFTEPLPVTATTRVATKEKTMMAANFTTSIRVRPTGTVSR